MPTSCVWQLTEVDCSADESPVLDYKVKFPWHSETLTVLRRRTTRGCCPRLGSRTRHHDISAPARTNPHLTVRSSHYRSRIQKLICHQPMSCHRPSLTRCPNGSQVRCQQVCRRARDRAGGITVWIRGVLPSTALRIHLCWIRSCSFNLVLVGCLPQVKGPTLGGRSYRGSYEASFFTGAESDIAGDDGSTFRNLNLSDSQEQQVGRRSSKQGMKRRAGSPPSGVARDDKSPSRGLASAEPSHQKLYTIASARSPVSRYYQPKHGSVSSTASSVRHNSYASSIALSIAGSSMTSISSFERQSPLDPAAQPAYLASVQHISSPATSIASCRIPPTHSPLDTKPPVRQISTQPVMTDSRPPPATRVGNYFLCECCPKKPKKFDREDELRYVGHPRQGLIAPRFGCISSASLHVYHASCIGHLLTNSTRTHQMEKPYTCQYCNNRFKNKNEAERHQNSLHLRRQSWSCATISSYHAAFHPSSAPTPPGAGSSLTDTCGYCGEEFPNLPQPDWDRRIDHLTNVHKFGECNQAKKFFRADHFRQHLKHSHAGQSGKWTNLLENVCLREENPQDPAGISPSGSDSSPGRGPSSLPEPPMGGATINEAHDET